MIKFDFSSIPIPLSGKVIEYICPKCKVEFEASLEAVLEFEQEDEWMDYLYLLHPTQFVQNVITINVFL